MIWLVPRPTDLRECGVLRVDAIHQDVTFTKAMTVAVNREVKDLACWLELDLALPVPGPPGLRQ